MASLPQQNKDPTHKKQPTETTTNQNINSNWITALEEGLDGGRGSGIYYSLKIYPIIHLIKFLGYSLK